MVLPALIAVALFLAAIIINPFREMCTWDDSFAYARMVQHLLSTGHYQLDAWAAASMPVQIYLAAGLAKIFGYSLSLLRCTTICLFVVAIASFYRLLRDLGHGESLAAILTLAIPATPLVLMLAFTFMSDVQFLGWLLLALFLYARGIHKRSITYMLLGSLAAACAIGTRQFGIAILFGLAATWSGPCATVRRRAYC
jgi:4-amino-4-deoxy-L-arabinose transferase-like glycosyltransferase